MKLRKDWIASLCVAALLTAPGLPLFAQGSREAFNKAVKDLQEDPGSNTLRKKIFKLGAELKELPEDPDEVAILKGKASYIVKTANSQADFAPAVAAYKKATNLAPWDADLYYNLGVVQEKAGQPEDATNSFKLYLAAKPDADDRDKVLARLGALEVQQEKHQEVATQTVAKHQATAADRRAHEQWESMQAGSMVFGVLGGVFLCMGVIFVTVGLGGESDAVYATAPGYYKGTLYNIPYEGKYWSSSSYQTYKDAEGQVTGGLVLGSLGLLGVVVAVAMSPGPEPQVGLLDVKDGKLALGLPQMQPTLAGGWQGSLLHAEF